MLKQGTSIREGKSSRLFSVNTLERCAFFCEGDMDKKEYTKKCLECKKEMSKVPKISYGQWENLKFCSMKCFYKNRKKRIKKQCLYCKKVIYVAPYLLKLGSGKFCDMKCYAKWQSENRRLENNYSWKGGSDDTYRSNARKKISENKIPLICEICGKHNSVVVHHKDQNVKNNNLSNLRPLCKSCHVNLHNKLGKKTKKDLAKKFTCHICKKIFLVNTNRNRKVCSSECSYEYSRRGLHWRNHACKS